ncbi:protein of unknown function [Taphrina deformans PYCC 5710]|uniref:alpha-galactosidase n=1 Tax=Taphrina deformans (strain PYCC 5710 / ATCC 11124 / CBS 356.35 / IMI 108563 / JCM 9778 / NBRC 8474) TaxID=1097556 RepID=R4XIT9_TAPDE|nr:protein of unknown function [Taphrina deformans PYCC 5710]|eukprot:CCG84409.1 protein of unknown function [Taphrina deformans PYCC 5710]
MSVSTVLSIAVCIGPALVSAWYRPAVDTTWAIQYSGTYLDVSNPATVYDIDGFNATANLISGLHGAGHRVICYFSAGSIESYTPDAKQFPASVAGKVLDGWPDEKWLDVRQLSILRPLMLNRAQIAKDKGCDGLDWDNVDGY